MKCLFILHLLGKYIITQYQDQANVSFLYTHIPKLL